MMTKESLELARILWDYHHVNHQVKKSDCIMALGSHDLRVAERGAELWLQGYAPLLILSGGLGNFTRDMWTEPEADKFARIAIGLGVPARNIIVENKSGNTGENIRFTKKILDEKGINPNSFILVQKPYMERRTSATFLKQWPGKEILVTSPQISFEEYPTPEIPMERVIAIMVGDLQRIKDYPEKGFQIFQEIPDEVWRAYERLIELGFDSHLSKT
jgi:uncharacterized SAM-binding protein YcdF (DUF218 family)